MHPIVAHEVDRKNIMRILVAVLTYKREAELQECLRSINMAAQDVSSRRNLSVDVLVADNDPDSRREETYIPNCRRMKTGLRSVAGGRQFLLTRGREEHYDYLIFVDDDEVVSTNWLSSMLQTASTHNCAGVAGPVLPLNLAAHEVPLHTRRRHETGTPVRSAGAGNLLLNLKVVCRTNFDVEWPLIGGEDTDFTTRLTQLEGPIVWCDEGEVFEPVAVERKSRRWLVDRYFNNGRILYASTVAFSGRAKLSNTALRFAALLLSTLRLIVLPFSSRAFRYFLDNGVRNLGYLYQSVLDR